MQVALTVAGKSFRRAITSKIFVIFLLFAFGLIFLSMLFEILTFAAKLKIIKDVGLTSISIFTAFIAIFLSGEALVGEMERKTIYILLSKPVSRSSLVVGSFLGIVWTTLVALATTGGAFILLILLKQGFIEGGLLIVLGFIGLETLVISSIGVMFSSFTSSSITAMLLCLFTYIMGHLLPHLKLLVQILPGKLVKELITVLSWILPNLEYFNVREKVVGEESINFFYIGKACLYSLCYTGIMLILCYFVVRRKEI